MSLSSEIRQYALELGYDRVGFTTAEKFPIYERELAKRHHWYRWAVEGSWQLMRSADPKNILPEARSIIVAVYDYLKCSIPQEMLGKIGGSKAKRILESNLAAETSEYVRGEIEGALAR